jgi:hypothetical protein
VHKLVKLVFTGPSRGRQVRHLDDDPQNCALSNLRYGTRKDNERDKRKNREKRRKKEEEKTRGNRKQFRQVPGSRGLSRPVSGGRAGR